MKYMRGFGVIMAVSFAGELLRYIIPLKIPASIYGFVIMIILLKTGLLSLKRVKKPAIFLIEIMPLMFVPPTVGLMVNYNQLQKILIPFMVTVLFSTIIVMVVSGHVTQFFIYRKRKRGNK